MQNFVISSYIKEGTSNQRMQQKQSILISPKNRLEIVPWGQDLFCSIELLILPKSEAGCFILQCEKVKWRYFRRVGIDELADINIEIFTKILKADQAQDPMEDYSKGRRKFIKNTGERNWGEKVVQRSMK